MNFKAKIILPTVVLATALLSVGGLSIVSSQHLVDAVHRLVEHELPAVSLVLNADRDLYQARVAQERYISLEQEGADSTSARNEFNENAEQARERLLEVFRLLNLAETDQMKSVFENSYNAWFQSAKAGMDLASRGDNAAAWSLQTEEVVPKFNQLRNHYDQLGEKVNAYARDFVVSKEQYGKQHLTIILVALVVSIGAGVAAMLYGFHALFQVLKEFKTQSEAVSDGDLTTRMTVKSQDELGQMASEFNQLISNIQAVITSFKSHCSTVSAGSDELERAAKENNRSVQQNNQSISEITFAVDQMQKTSQVMADDISSTATRVTEAAKCARINCEMNSQFKRQMQTLSENMQQASDGIEQLAAGSEQIASMIDVIQGIAEQTNLLALNAAIEAARAGEQGRGFAVVADEVRGLAHRTQASTKDINNMIEGLNQRVNDSVSLVKSGKEMVEGTVQLFSESEASSNAVTEHMETINSTTTNMATAADQQAKSASQIFSNIQNINSHSQASSARSQEVDNTIEGLVGNLGVLSQSVAKFRVD